MTATRRGWIHPEVYREARKAGFPPAYAAYLGRDPVVNLSNDGDHGWDSGIFEYSGLTFRYLIEWDDDCLCHETDVTPDEYDRMEHRIVIVQPGDDQVLLGSVCGLRLTWLDVRGDDRCLAEVCRDLADELLSRRA